MQELVFKSEKGTPITNSLLVAQKFGKEHRNVLQNIRNLTAENSAVSQMFYETTYFNERNQQQPMYTMNRDGFSILVMGFTGSQALNFKVEFINAFNKMEQTIKRGGFQVPSTFSEALLLAAKQQELIEQKDKLIEEQAPMVRLANAITSADTDILIRDLAKLITQNGYSIGEIRLYDWMTENKYLIRRTRWSNKKQRYENDYTPTQRAAELKVFFVTENVISTGEHSFIKHTVKVTPKGQLYFINKFTKHKAA